MYPSPTVQLPIRVVSAATVDMIHTMVAAAVLALNLLAAAARGAGASPPPPQSISSCLLSNGVSNFSLPSSPSYTPLFYSSIRYLRFENNPSVSKPAAVVLPASKQELQRAVVCVRSASLAIRVRSGGHSYEGLSYTTENHVPFVVIDLSNLNRVRVDAAAGTAWAESGATIGELYYAVGRSSRTLAFPGGTCATIGLGGIISGGGFGVLSRKFGLAADNVLDATLIDASGNTLTRATMDADVFWAIRGGGGGSFGVVYSWTLRLVPVPEKITVFAGYRTGPVDVIAPLIHKWQFVGPQLPDDFYLSTKVYFPGDPNMTFTGQFLVPKQQATAVLNEAFPELGLAESELSEVSWVESTLKFAVLNSVDELTDRQVGVGEYAKRKSDYTQAPISKPDMVEIFRYLSTRAPTTGSIQLSPYGGAMARIGSTETPFPHRAGYLYNVQYAIDWTAAENGRRGEEFMAWLRSFYAFMAPHVASPRGAYVNYIDLDLGTDNWTEPTGIGASHEYNAMVGKKAAATWGQRYFLHNFDRLVRAKAKIDPENVFNHAQSIPPSL